MAANQGTSLLKITQFSKDMNIKSKEVIEMLAGKGVEVKSSSSLEVSQFELVFNALTLDNQIDNIGNYLDGVTYIPSKKKPAAAKSADKQTVADETIATEAVAKEPEKSEKKEETEE